MRILVAMSGGVDSSVVSHLLKQQGHELIGVQFRLWTDPLAPPLAKVLPSKCCSEATIGRAKKVAEDLDIPLHCIDLSDEFKREVVDPFLEGYENGLTPNPCINCNRTIKFGKLLEVMKEFDCEKIATGHYARCAHVKSEKWKVESSDTYLLLEAVDKQKDQSYYLYGLSQEQLSHVLFPLGSMEKQDVFRLAREFSVPISPQYRESQDLCFFPEKDPHAFLHRHLSPTPGDIRDTTGQKRGTHRGLPHYTEGQRKGLGIGGLTIPLHVVTKEVKTNTLVVGLKEEASRSNLTAHNARWVSWKPSAENTHEFDARVHSLGQRHRCQLWHDGKHLDIRFMSPVLGIAPGQSIVLYRGQEVVGGGTIAS